MAGPILELTHITKTFPGVRALDDVRFERRLGEIHALIGENGDKSNIEDWKKVY